MGIARGVWGIVVVGLFLLTIVPRVVGATADPPATGIHVSYVFVADQSTVFQMGGLADIFETYSIEGTFELMIDYKARKASFVRVDANLVGDSPFLPTRSLNELFNMTQLAGRILDETMIVFLGNSADGTDSPIQLFLMLTPGKVELQGSFTPPCCDLFSYDMDAVVKCTYGGGSGERNDPYLIYTPEHMYGVGASGDDWDKHFKLMADIDLSVFDGKVGFNVIGTTDKSAFTGVFDGNGHTISHLTITGKDYVGLFGCVSGEVKNLGVVDVRITGSGSCVGALVGWNLYGTMTNCYSTGAVSGTGQWRSSLIGGLVGDNGGTVTQCYSTGTVSGTGQYAEVGGLVGSNGGSVTQCYSTGAVSGTGEGVGGLVGDNGGTVTECYSVGAVKGAGEFVGGLVGFAGQFSIVIACFWDIQTSGRAKSAGGTGRTTAQMQTASTFQVWACDSEGIWTIDEGKDYPRLSWENRAGEPVRHLTELSDLLKGTGNQDDPFLIYSAEDLNVVGLFPPCYGWFGYFKLMADIDLSALDGKDGRPAFNIIAPCGGGRPFNGFFDGNGHRISHLTVKTSGSGEWGGLFGALGEWAEVKDLGVVDVNITSSGGGAGGLVGANGMWPFLPCGIVTNCYSTGAVSGKDGVGGLVGSNGGSVTQCYSTAAVSGTREVGGLVGSNNAQGYAWGATVTQCYSTGAVSGTDSVGGLVGFGGQYSHVIACFWDIQTSGRAKSAGGTGRTTAQMQDPNTFMAMGWDFVGQPDGPDHTWAQPEGGGYPILWWQLSPWPELPRFSGGSGEPNDPYLISTPEQLSSIGHKARLMTCHFKLMADIDLSPLDGKDGRPVFNIIAPCGGSRPFAGFFDGNGHRISHLTVKTSGSGECAGLFGALGEWAEVKDLGVVDVNITSSGGGAGGLVGANGMWSFPGGIVTNCYSTGAVSGKDGVGGLVGSNGGSVTRCYSTAAVSGDLYSGGLVGSLSGGTVTQCYSTGAVSGDSCAGGLVGFLGWGTVTRCYSTGVVSGTNLVGGLVGSNDYDGTVNECFWDVETSGQTVSDGGTGKTTAEMQTAKTFLDAGWDFVGETADGTEDVWWILEGKDYPRLWWEMGDEASP